MKKFLKNIKNLFRFKSEQAVRIPESLYELIKGERTGSRSLHLHEIKGCCEVIRLNSKHPFPNVTVNSTLHKHEVKLVPYGKFNQKMHYEWTIKFHGTEILGTIYLKSRTFDTSKFLSLQGVGQKDIAGTLANWTYK